MAEKNLRPVICQASCFRTFLMTHRVAPCLLALDDLTIPSAASIDRGEIVMNPHCARETLMEKIFTDGKTARRCRPSGAALLG